MWVGLSAQSIQNRSSANVTVMDANVFAGSSFRVPVANDTASANLWTTLDSCGKLLYTRDSNSVWLRKCNPKRWSLIGGSGGGGSYTNGYGIYLLGNTFSVDTFDVATRPRVQKAVDSLGVIKAGYSQFIGEIVNQSTWPSLTGWTANGATVSLSGGYPQISAPAFNCEHTFDYDYVTGAEYWTIKSTLKIKSADAMPSVGIRPLVGPIGLFGRIIQQSGTSYYVDIIGNCGGTTVRCDSFITVNVNDVLEFLFERSGNQFYLAVRNITTDGPPYIVQYMYNTNIDILPTTGKPCVYAYTGNYEMQSFSFSNRTLKLVQLMAVTDSKFAPYQATYNTACFQQIAKNYNVVLSTNPNDQTYEVKQKLPELLNINSYQIFLSIGSNDIRAGHSVASVIADIDSIVTVLRAAGARVYIANGTYETTLNLAPLKDAINARYSPDSVIDTWTPSLADGFLSSDGIHIGDYGQKVMYDLLINSFIFNNPQYQVRTNENAYINNGTAEQIGSFNVSGESRVGNTFSMGKSSVTTAFKAYHPSGLLQLVGYGGYSNLRSYNSTSTSYANMLISAGSTTINTASGLTEYEGLAINRDVSRFGGGLVIGNQYNLSNTEALGVNVGNSSYTSLLNFSGTNYLQFINTFGGNNGTPLNMRASSYSLNSFTAGVATLNIFAQDGKVGIATNTPDTVLTVSGGLRINNGAAQSGYVWTSQGTDGRATWLPASGGSSYSAGYGLLLSGSTFKADSLVMASWEHLYKVNDSMKVVTSALIHDSLNANNFYIQNLGGEDTLAVALNDSTLGIKSLKDSTGIGFAVRDGVIVIYNTGGGLSSSNFVFNEVPSGTINGVNTTFTLANTPTAGTVVVFLRGLRMKLTTDYTISGTTLTMINIPDTGDDLIVDYLK